MSPHPFQVMIKPASGDCNLACRYCFYRGKQTEIAPGVTRPRMSLDLVEQLVEELLSYGFPETVFVWQGGEPTLMGLDFFRQVVDLQRRHGKPGQVVGNALQTNGLLIDDEWARFLARFRFLVGLSVDGPEDLHDQHRISSDGRGSFDAAMAAAERLRSAGVAFNVLSVVTRHSGERGAETYRFLRAFGFQHLQFIPCVETGSEHEELAPFSIDGPGMARFWSNVFEEYRSEGPRQVSERTFDALLRLHLEGRTGLCTFDDACGSYLLIEHDGGIYPCDFFVEPRWKLGVVGQRPLASFFELPLMRRFANARANIPGECRSCDHVRWCHGGCLKDRVSGGAEETGRTVLCPAYRRLFDVCHADAKRWAEELQPPGAASRSKRTRIGRNDPCGCGSGRKYKRCCGR